MTIPAASTHRFPIANRDQLWSRFRRVMAKRATANAGVAEELARRMLGDGLRVDTRPFFVDELTPLGYSVWALPYEDHLPYGPHDAGFDPTLVALAISRPRQAGEYAAAAVPLGRSCLWPATRSEWNYAGVATAATVVPTGGVAAGMIAVAHATPFWWLAPVGVGVAAVRATLTETRSRGLHTIWTVDLPDGLKRQARRATHLHRIPALRAPVAPGILLSAAEAAVTAMLAIRLVNDPGPLLPSLQGALQEAMYTITQPIDDLTAVDELEQRCADIEVLAAATIDAVSTELSRRGSRARRVWELDDPRQPQRPPRRERGWLRRTHLPIYDPDRRRY